MPRKDLPHLQLSRESRFKLREKWKWGPCYDFDDDGLGYCMLCNWDHGANWRSISQKRIMVCAAVEKMKTGECGDLFAEPMDVPAAIEWFLRWMQFRPAA